jgi:hypothetical protein
MYVKSLHLYVIITRHSCFLIESNSLPRIKNLAHYETIVRDDSIYRLEESTLHYDNFLPIRHVFEDTFWTCLTVVQGNEDFELSFRS